MIRSRGTTTHVLISLGMRSNCRDSISREPMAAMNTAGSNPTMTRCRELYSGPASTAASHTASGIHTSAVSPVRVQAHKPCRRHAMIRKGFLKIVIDPA